jgi:transketolase
MNNIKQLSKKIRLTILETIYRAKTGHIGGSFSCIDILIVLFFKKIIFFNPIKLKMKNRDRFILSKGHATAALYSIFAHLKLIRFEELNTYCSNNSRLGSHPSHLVPGVEIETGSLGHGLPISCGIAYAALKDKKKFKIYTLISDGEIFEGSTWESFIFASHHKLNNLVIIIDNNNQIVMDYSKKIGDFNNLKNKLTSFNFNVFEIDGHNLLSLEKTLKKSKRSKKTTVIIANTIKGKGVSFMEKNIKWHHSIPNEEEYLLAKNELEKKLI